jgi:hypothetical protein
MCVFIVFVTQRLFQMDDLPPVVHGILSLEFDGRPAHLHDGFCVTVLLSLTTGALSAETSANFSWKDVEDSVMSVLQQLMQPNALPGLL